MSSFTGMARRTNGSAIKDLREAIGISQTELARRTGITASQLSKVERGANGMSPEATRRVADALGVNLDSITYPVPEPAATS